MPSIFDHKYPYTNFEELNLDWFLHEFKHAADGWDQAKAEAETATANANSAASSANSAASNANSKAGLADSAATAANSAASNAANNAALAESAASVADSAAQAANTAASAADGAASSANSAASAADSAASSANSAAATATAAAASAASRVGVLYIPATISGTTVTCSATDTDIVAALSANKAVVVRVGTEPDLDYFYLAKSETLPGPGAPFAFTFVNKDGDTLICSVLSGWSYETAQPKSIVIPVVDDDDCGYTGEEIKDMLLAGINVTVRIDTEDNDIIYAFPSQYWGSDEYMYFESKQTNPQRDYKVTITDDGTAYIYPTGPLTAVISYDDVLQKFVSTASFSEIKFAISQGRNVDVLYDGDHIALTNYTSGQFHFYYAYIDDATGLITEMVSIRIVQGENVYVNTY